MLMTEIFRVAADFMASSSASSDAMIAQQVKKVRRSTSSNVRNQKSLQQLTESFGGIWETKAFSAWVNGLCEQQVKPSQHLHLCNFRFERLHLSLQWFMKAADQLNPLGTGEGLVWHDWVC
jgi:hypothetical protein